MSEEIDSGTVLGGRYQVGELIVATEEGDRVYAGTDQVLNRAVSILTAAPHNATRLAVAAREIAIETRPSPVKVLDLGISQSTTYLIAADAEAADMLDLVIENGTPYVEPFMTDTLGSEIFGESRSYEPQVYDDDAEYYEELAHEQARKPLFSGFAGRFRNRRNRNQEVYDDYWDTDDESNDEQGSGAWAAGFGAGAAAGTGAGSGASSGAGAGTGAGSGSGAGAGAGSQHPAISDPHETQPENLGSSELPPVEPSSAGASDSYQSGPIASVPTSASEASQESARNRDTGRGTGRSGSRGTDGRGTGGGAAAGGFTGFGGFDFADVPTEMNPIVTPGMRESREDADARAAREASERDGEMRPASRFPRQAFGAGAAAGAGAGASGAAASADGTQSQAFEDAEPEDSGNKLTRVIVGGLLGLLMIGGVVFAVGNLTKDKESPAPVASASQENKKKPENSGGSESPSPSEKEKEKEVKPAVQSISRLVPGAPELNADTDGELPKAIDGSLATSYQTYSYTTPQFGNYAQSMALVLELEETASVKQVKLEGLNGVGGNMQILVGDTENISDAKEAYSGSFSGPTLEAGLGKGVEGKYVFVNITELPKIASGGPSGRPYGFTVAEINVE